MSEFINNASQKKARLKQLIKMLHDGINVNEVKEIFESEFDGVTTEEISAIEQELIAEGLPVSEVQKLCDVHATLFKGGIDEIHPSKDPREIMGHPANIFHLENVAIEKLIKEQIYPYLHTELSNDDVFHLRLALEQLQEVDKHYARKENLFFPYLEKHGHTAPPQVMWGVDNEIRAELKVFVKEINSVDLDATTFHERVKPTIDKVFDMITKEEKILIPLMNDSLTFNEWFKVGRDAEETELCLIDYAPAWEAELEDEGEASTSDDKKIIDGEIQFSAGTLTQEEVNCILNTVPVDMTFVDANDKVKYFTQGKHRIFDRPKAVLGREVSMCHPPQSVHVVEDIVADLRSGKKDQEDFWLQVGPMFVHIRYYAVRNEEGEYLGCLEVSQDIQPLRDLEGEKRLVEDK